MRSTVVQTEATMDWKETQPGIFCSDESTIRFSRREINFLVAQARASANRRARLCAHATVIDPVHEMLICLLDDGYIRPHCHAKHESLHAIEGKCDLILFDETGCVKEVRRLGTGDDDLLYVRLAPGAFHTLHLRTEFFVFHETTRGPFDRAGTEFASWAPAETDREAVARYLKCLEAAIADFGTAKRGSQ